MNRIANVYPYIAALGLCAVVPACAGARAEPPASAADRGDATLTAEALFARGTQLARSGDAVRAEQYLLLALRAGYPHERAIVPLVQVCIASSRLRAALGHAEPFLRRHPDVWRLRYLTAAIHLALDQPSKALTELRRVLAQQPDAAQAHYLLGVTLRDAFRDHEAARASFEAYLRTEPEGAHAAELLAWLAEQRDVQRAASDRPVAIGVGAP